MRRAVENLKSCVTNIDIGMGGGIKIRLGRRKRNITPFVLQELVACIDALEWYEMFETVCNDVKEICQYFGVPVRKSGVGWIIGDDF